MLKMKNLHSKANKRLNGIKAKGTDYAEGSVQNPQRTKIKSRAALKQAPVMETAENFNSRQLLKVLMEVKNGNFGVRMPIDEIGLNGKICDTMNEIITLNERMMIEFTKAGQIIG